METLLEELDTKQDSAGKAAARKHSVNKLVARETTKERICLLGRKARKLPTDVALRGRKHHLYFTDQIN